MYLPFSPLTLSVEWQKWHLPCKRIMLQQFVMVLLWETGLTQIIQKVGWFASSFTSVYRCTIPQPVQRMVNTCNGTICEMTYTVSSGMLNSSIPYHTI